jgi:hypothetical protein
MEFIIKTIVIIAKVIIVALFVIYWRQDFMIRYHLINFIINSIESIK